MLYDNKKVFSFLTKIFLLYCSLLRMARSRNSTITLRSFPYEYEKLGVSYQYALDYDIDCNGSNIVMEYNDIMYMDRIGIFRSQYTFLSISVTGIFTEASDKAQISLMQTDPARGSMLDDINISLTLNL